MVRGTNAIGRDTGTGIAGPARLALLVATVCGVGLVGWALWYPSYEGVEMTDEVSTTQTSTLIEVNGPGALVPVLIPLVVTLLVVVLLHLRALGARVVAGVLVGLLYAFAAIAMLSIGSLMLPVAIALTVAVAWPRSERKPA